MDSGENIHWGPHLDREDELYWEWLGSLFMNDLGITECGTWMSDVLLGFQVMQATDDTTDRLTSLVLR